MSTSSGRATVRVIGAEQDAEQAWQRVANGLPHSTLAHAPEWRTVIRQAYGHEQHFQDEIRQTELPPFHRVTRHDAA